MNIEVKRYFEYLFFGIQMLLDLEIVATLFKSDKTLVNREMEILHLYQVQSSSTNMKWSSDVVFTSKVSSLQTLNEISKMSTSLPHSNLGQRAPH